MEGLYLFPLVAVVLVVAGAAVLVRARRGAQAWKRFVGASQVTQAQVVEVRTKVPTYASDRSPYYVPVVRFPLLDGRFVETETMSGSRPAPARVGEVVMVRFDPADSSRVALADGVVSSPAFTGCVLVALGVGFVGLGLLLGLFSVFLLAVARS